MRLLHAADFHLGLKTHGKFDSATGLNTRLLSTKHCVEASVDHAIENDVDAYLFAGDAFHTKNPSPTQIRLLINALKPLVEENIPVIMITGNHDHPVTEGKTHGVDVFSEISGFYVSDEPEHFLLATPGFASIDTYRGLDSIENAKERVLEDYEDLTVVSTLPWPIAHKLQLEEGESVSARYLAHLKRGAKLASDLSAKSVSLGHFTVDGSLPSGSEESLQLSSESSLSPSRLAGTGIGYHALGHIHKFQDLGTKKGGAYRPVVYSSSIDRIFFDEEDQDRHVILIDTEDLPYREEGQYKKLPLPATEFLTIVMDLRDEESPTAAIEENLKDYPVEGAIVRFIYHLDEDQVVDESEIQQLLSPAENIVQITRERNEARRQRSEGVRDEADLETLLSEFVESRELEGGDEIIETGLDVKRSVQSQ